MEIINAYDEFTVSNMIENACIEAVKADRRKRKERLAKKRQALKQKLILKGLSLALVVLGLIIASVVKFDNGGCLVAALIGLMGLAVPFNMEITW